jgi:hypothetical protein
VRRLVATGIPAVALAAPASAQAHGLVGRSDLPIPEWLFGWGACAVLVLSFIGLTVLWTRPRLEGASVRPLFAIPHWLDAACGLIGVAAFTALVYAGYAGNQTPTANAVPTFVYVLLWCGLVPISALFGDVFRAFNPWRAIGRAGGRLAARLVADDPPAPLAVPGWVGRWPAVAGLLGFAFLELIAADGDKPRVLATAALVYLGVQLAGMALYGVREWEERGDAFGVYFGFFARLAPLAVEHGRLVWRRPLSGLADVRWLPGTVAFLCAAIGITAFDGASEGDLFSHLLPALQDGFAGLGLGASSALTLAFVVGLALCILVVAGFYRLGIQGVRGVDGRRSARELARRFAPSLVPIALAYVVAHYFSLLVYQGQAVGYLASDPLGDGSDWLGTAGAAIDYGVISATAIWYVQVAALVAGHVGGLALAHDRALVDYGLGRAAVRSQYWMLAVMIGFTSLGLWLLSEGNG